MIKDIPTPDDFNEQGLTLLNLAWDSVIGLLLDFRDAWEFIGDQGNTTEYRRASQKPLAIATALLQQGTEFLVKAAIAKVSPFLLISGNAQGWPKKCDSSDVPFSNFRTADAEDLIRIHDTVSARRFSPAFIQKFGEMRRIRNTIFHSVDRNLRFDEAEILCSILFVHAELLGQTKWMDNREKYLDSVPGATLSYSGSCGPLVREFGVLRHFLTDSILKTHFGFSKKLRSFYCPKCLLECREFDPDIAMSAQLSPNLPSSTEVHCCVCRSNSPIRRDRCKAVDCRGNVISISEEYDRICLTCKEDWDE